MYEWKEEKEGRGRGGRGEKEEINRKKKGGREGRDK